MTPENGTNPGGFDERTLLTKQCLRYAEDLVKLYEEDRATRKELERIKKKLIAEMAGRREIEQALQEGLAR